jgi:4-diphosphocytidyl-2-C-methyl-D-erythritol kinase
MTFKWWPAPAKLNLFLHVTGRRPDGYHDLQTAFQLLDLCDEVGLAASSDGAIERLSGPAGVPADADLTVRAARALMPYCKGQFGVQIQLRKRIPAGAGLGGGSSDAATVLVVLNRLWDTGLDPGQLAELGATLGADVPVFVLGDSAWAEGRGERLQPIVLPDRWFLVIYPGVAVSTAELFQAPELTRNSPVITIRALFEGATRNDFEPIVRARQPAVAAAIDWLSAYAPARLTGTGSSVYAAFAEAAQAERIAARVPDEWHCFVARGVNRSPLHAALQAAGDSLGAVRATLE